MRKIGKYNFQGYINKGSFGKVYKASLGSQIYAIKQMREPQTEYDKVRLKNEIKALSELNHQNIVKLYEVFFDQGCIYLVMEYCEESLQEFLVKHGAMDEPRAFQIMKQIIRGFNQLIKLKIVHRDLKPANILYHKGAFKIADFGLAKHLQNEEQILQSAIGTYAFMAPQILKKEKYTRKCDIWSLGMVFYYILFGEYPWDMSKRQKLLSNILTLPINFPRKISEHNRDIIKKMLIIDEKKRSSWNQVFNAFQVIPKFEEKVVHIFEFSSFQKLIGMEIDHQSKVEYGRGFKELNGYQKKFIMKNTMLMFNEPWKMLVLSVGKKFQYEEKVIDF